MAGRWCGSFHFHIKLYSVYIYQGIYLGGSLCAVFRQDGVRERGGRIFMAT